MPNPDRAARLKWVSVDGVAAFIARERLLRAGDDQLDIDVTDLAPVDAANVIIRLLDVDQDNAWDVDPAERERRERRADPRRGGCGRVSPDGQLPQVRHAATDQFVG